MLVLREKFFVFEDSLCAMNVSTMSRFKLSNHVPGLYLSRRTAGGGCATGIAHSLKPLGPVENETGRGEGLTFAKGQRRKTGAPETRAVRVLG